MVLGLVEPYLGVAGLESRLADLEQRSRASLHVLLVEDDQEVAGYLVRGLSESGHVVEHVADGEVGLHSALEERFDVIILDRMLPKRDGMKLLRLLRTDGNDTPVLFLSALGEVEDRVDGLRAGADDYLVKPFAFAELLARLESITRRKGSLDGSPILTVEDLEFDLWDRRVTRAGQEIHLLPREMKLLEVFMRNAGRVLTRTMLLEKVWDIHFDPQSNVVDTQICRLRMKLDKGYPNQLLRTVRGGGYRLG